MGCNIKIKSIRGKGPSGDIQSSWILESLIFEVPAPHGGGGALASWDREGRQACAAMPRQRPGGSLEACCLPTRAGACGEKGALSLDSSNSLTSGRAVEMIPPECSTHSLNVPS